MTSLPLLVLPKATATIRQKGTPKFISIAFPSIERQKDRLGDKFDRLRAILSKSPDEKLISSDTEGLYPEKTIVFELAQPKANFKKAVEKLGLKWVGEDSLEIAADQDFHKRDGKETALDGRLYLTAPDQKSLDALLGMWKNYIDGKIPDGKKEWNDLFSHLRDIRRWGEKDRLPNETLDYLESISDEDFSVRLEIEAIFYGEISKDEKSRKNLSAAIVRANAKILDVVTISEIRYHGLLIEIQKSEIEKLRNFESALLRIDEVGYIRPQSMSVGAFDGDYSEEEEFVLNSELQLANPVAALFDGVPIAEHQLLEGRLIVHDPDNLQATSPVQTRNHGTAMASLILHGDIPLDEEIVPRKLYLHCLLSTSDRSGVETTRQDKLLIGLILNAVKDIVETKNSDLKEICIINISLGDVNRPFVGAVSAWARLIDYLSWKYSLLFIVSSGNIKNGIVLRDNISISKIRALSVEDRRKAFVQAMEDGFAKRTIFSPAESVNALTVGALHADASSVIENPFLLDPFESADFPSLINGMGLGYRRSVKPDILHNGGRALYSYENRAGELIFEPSAAAKYFGQEVASSKSINATTRIVGTSNAAALTTRGAIKIYNVLQEMQLLNPGFSISKRHLPCLLKALLLHSASWGKAGEFLESVIQPQSGKQWQNRRSNITRMLGYGRSDFEKVLGCTEHRVTLVGTGSIAAEKAELFEFPLPPGLSGSKEIRRLTVTLSWISPLLQGEQNYRSAALEFKPADKEGFPIGAKRVADSQPPIDMTKRGTVVHEIFEGQDAVPILDGDMLRLRVESKAQGGAPDPVPYALVVTFEVAEAIQTNIYQEISSRIGVRAATKVRT
ncbi:S8 family peptidase [Janthinobacterium sp. SUN137]|uniref:S8 family peptidase n=1 Tax=Janthinobacterium sp. SUN137 TaxID=3014789 RepID=UPI002713CE3F|nr:S8 family peptidase [Janthinobacterium sp. SUN137]MDO8042464.1 S8 family peptidase [Janthinobacterium sp. SUN137]